MNYDIIGNWRRIINEIRDIPEKVSEMELPIDRRKAQELGEFLGIDFDEYDFQEFLDGFNDEAEEHGKSFDDIRQVSRIVLDHLDKDPQYYSRMMAAMGDDED